VSPGSRNCGSFADVPPRIDAAALDVSVSILFAAFVARPAETSYSLPEVKPGQNSTATRKRTEWLIAKRATEFGNASAGSQGA
jgi:hypothetical protein